MWRISSKPVARFFLSSLVLATALLSLLTGASPAFAMRSVCRTDPVVVLSNGAILDVSATIQTDVSNIDNIEYVLHVPAGVKALTILYTDILPPIHEKVTLVQDSGAGSYSFNTTVHLEAGADVPATVNAWLNVLDVRSGSGMTGSPIVVPLGKK